VGGEIVDVRNDERHPRPIHRWGIDQRREPLVMLNGESPTCRRSAVFLST